MYYRRQPETPLPSDRTFIVNLADGTSLRINATAQMVTLYHHRKLHQEPIWRAIFFLADNPALAALYTPRLGWDIVGLISLMRSEVMKMMRLDLRDPELREEAGLSTVSIPSHNRSKQEKRPMGQALEMIADFVAAHPQCTRLEIARGIGRAKSPHLLVQIEWLVQQKVIVREQFLRANGFQEYRYTIVDDNEN